MPVSIKVLLSQITAHVIGIILSIFIIAPMSISLFKFKSHCLLFSYGNWSLSIGEVTAVRWASSGYCGFVILVGALMLVLCCVQTYRLLKCLYDGREWLLTKPLVEASLYLLMTGFMMYAGLVVTLGFMTWCDYIMQRYETCKDGDGEMIDSSFQEDFFIDFLIVQVVVWLAFAVCVTFTGYSFINLYRLYSPGNSPTSSHNEREPLLNPRRIVP